MVISIFSCLISLSLITVLPYIWSSDSCLIWVLFSSSLNSKEKSSSEQEANSILTSCENLDKAKLYVIESVFESSIPYKYFFGNRLLVMFTFESILERICMAIGFPFNSVVFTLSVSSTYKYSYLLEI